MAPVLFLGSKGYIKESKRKQILNYLTEMESTNICNKFPHYIIKLTFSQMLSLQMPRHIGDLSISSKSE